MKNNWKVLDVDADLLESKEFEDFGGIEELDDYKLVFADGKVKETKKRKLKNKSKKKNKKTKLADSDESHFIDTSKSNEIDMSAWCNCFVPDPILQALKDLGFDSPTPIQKLAIPAAIRDHQDILGAAETGSGKTLAFGIPLISSILSIKERCKDDLELKRLFSIIITPTRELAIQIKQHLQAISKYTEIMIATVVGGMASQKQKRVLKKRPEIVVATPGRLWELIEEGEPHLSQIASVKHLVIDEADRMLEKGHFAELTQILALMNGNKDHKRQNFVFSATLTLVHETPQRLMFKKNKEKLQQKFKLESLINIIGMKESPRVIDITRKTALVETLTESQIMCSLEEKDAYLYYFLITHPGRTLVFCNSIDCVRRLRSVLDFLQCKPLPLHASMHQKQRLKNLEKFTSSKSAVLLATDVAARGLDIKGIEHVVHFQVPRTAETYVHRSGRTARAQNEGLSLMLIEPQEGTFYKRMCKTLNKDKALPAFNIQYPIFKKIRTRVNLARTLDKLVHVKKRSEANSRWLTQMANSMDVDLEDEEVLNEQTESKKNKEIKNIERLLKLELKKTIFRK